MNLYVTAHVDTGKATECKRCLSVCSRLRMPLAPIHVQAIPGDQHLAIQHLAIPHRGTHLQAIPLLATLVGPSCQFRADILLAVGNIGRIHTRGTRAHPGGGWLRGKTWTHTGSANTRNKLASACPHSSAYLVSACARLLAAPTVSLKMCDRDGCVVPWCRAVVEFRPEHHHHHHKHPAMVEYVVPAPVFYPPPHHHHHHHKKW